MKLLKELESQKTDLQEVVSHIKDDMRESVKRGHGSMYEFTKSVVAKYYPPNPFERIFGTPGRRNEISENTEGV
jgi:hypothetical protein